MMFNYFFGSDTRSLGFLETVNKKVPTIKVITLPHSPTGRGRKLKPNPVEVYCVNNNIAFEYYDSKETYKDMSIGLCVSFGKIFSEAFLKKNNKIFNIHLSLLPSYRGPSPVENSILNGETTVGYTIFQIDNKIDTGNIVFQESFKIDNDTYASSFYENVNSLFLKRYDQIYANLNKDVVINNYDMSTTNKFIKNDYNITERSLNTAKKMIRAFDVIGPAFVNQDNNFIKIHKYSDKEHEFPIELSDGVLYPSIITPEGKNKMFIEDFIRGRK